MPNLPSTITNTPPIQGNIADKNEEYRKKIGLLCKVGKKVGTDTELNKLLYQILKMSQKTLQVSASSLILVDKSKNEMYFKLAEGEAGKALRTITLSIDSGIAGWVVQNAKPVITNDVTSDPRFSDKMDKITGFVTKSLLAVPIVSEGEVIGVIEVLNKTDDTKFSKQDLEVLAAVASMSAVAINTARLHKGVLAAYKGTANALAAAIDAKDPYTRGHSQRVMEYTLLAASSLNFSPEELRSLEFASLLHDVGKIGIDTGILRKQGSLTNLEWLHMRMHTSIGANIIGVSPYMQKAREIVLRHHEKYDGSGYPDGLKGDKIPIGSRLIAVADAFDTMTTNRSYHSSMSIDEALNELTSLSGTQFCPVAAKAFVANFSKQREMLSYNM